MRIKADIIFPWQGNHASIPTGWVRETSLDGKYPKSYGNSVAPNETGGASTHTHSSPSHSHTLQDHTHTYVLGMIGNTTAGASSKEQDTPRDNHTHNGTSGSRSGGTTSSDAVTYGAVSNDPPYYEAIFIKSQNGHIPDDLIAYLNSADVPDNWFFCDGANGTPDLRNKYIKGAGAGNNAGATGGSLTNIHDISHSHTANTHTHVSAQSGGPNESGRGDGLTTAVLNAHSHSVSLNAATQAINAYSGSLTTAETVEPAYKKLLAIQKKTGGKAFVGLIGLFLGDVDDIPSGWVACDGQNGTPDLRDKYIKVANTTGEIGNTGGANSHTHAAQPHSHTSNGTHTHTGSVSAHVNHTSQVRAEAASSIHRDVAGSVHPLQSVQDVTANYDSANTSANSSSNEPLYRTAVYVMLSRIETGAVAMALLD